MSRPRNWADSAREGLKAYLVSRFVVFAGVMGGAWFLPARGPSGTILDTLRVWDAGWFVHIALHGYSNDPVGQTQYRSTAYFPAWPLLIRFLAGPWGPSDAAYAWTAIAAANLLFLLALTMLHRLVAIDMGQPVADRATWFLAFFPATIVCSTAYSESMFLVCVLAAFLCMRRGEALGFGAWAALASATRAVGVVLTVVAAARALEEARQGGPWKRWALGVMLAPLGLIAFFASNAWQFGDFFAYTHAQRAWGRNGFFNTQPYTDSLVWSIQGLARGIPESYTFPYFLLALFVAVAFRAARLNTPLARPYAVYMAAALAVYVISAVGALTGETRYLMVLFPAYVVFGVWAESWPPGGRLLLLGFAIDAALIAAFFTRHYPMF